MNSIYKRFIELLKIACPTVLSVYEFKKQIALFDRILKDKIGLVILVPEAEHYTENLLIIDLLYDKIQDQFGWENGTRFANSFSRGYIRTPSNLWHINIQNPHCLLPEDMINLLETRKLLFGEELILEENFPHNTDEIIKINVGLTRDEVEKIALEFNQFSPLVDPKCCWMRFPFTVEHSVFSVISNELDLFMENINPENNIHLYGRYGGSGKTQIIYSLMKYCREQNIPFVYRTEFWKDEEGEYYDIEINPDNNPKKVSEWVISNAPVSRFVLFLDEVDIDINSLQTGLKNRFNSSNSKIFIISASKEISSFTAEGFLVYDIVKEYPFTDSQLVLLLKKILDISHIDKGVFSDEILDKIINQTRLWNHTAIRKTPTSIILTAHLAFIEALRGYKDEKNKLVVKSEFIEKWAFLGTSPWYQEYGIKHDVHSEYFIFDGNEYTAVDRNYHFSMP